MALVGLHRGRRSGDDRRACRSTPDSSLRVGPFGRTRRCRARPTVRRAELKRRARRRWLIVLGSSIVSPPNGAARLQLFAVCASSIAALHEVVADDAADARGRRARLRSSIPGDGRSGSVFDRLTGEIGARRKSSSRRARRVDASLLRTRSWTQALPDWIDAHVRALEVIGDGVSAFAGAGAIAETVCYSKACRSSDPVSVNRQPIAEMAARYDTAIGRQRRPQTSEGLDRARKSSRRCSSSDEMASRAVAPSNFLQRSAEVNAGDR